MVAGTRYGLIARCSPRQVLAALKAEGFGVLTQRDVRAMVKEKLDAYFEP